jgi:hypothetical protein
MTKNMDYLTWLESQIEKAERDQILVTGLTRKAYRQGRFDGLIDAKRAYMGDERNVE